MRKFSQSLLLLAVLGLGLASIVSDNPADEGFTNASIAGSWAASASGSIVPPAVPAATPFAVVGTATFDKSGQCSVSLTLNAGGVTIPSTSDACTFGVNPDGTGFIELETDSPFSPIGLAITVVDDKEILLMGIDALVTSGAFKRQSRNDEDED